MPATTITKHTRVTILRPLAARTRRNTRVIRAGSRGTVLGLTGDGLLYRVATEDGMAALYSTDFDLYTGPDFQFPEGRIQDVADRGY